MPLFSSPGLSKSRKSYLLPPASALALALASALASAAAAAAAFEKCNSFLC